MMRPGVRDLMQLGSTAFSCIFLYLNSLVGVGWAVQSGILRLGVAMQTLDFWISGFLDGRMIWSFGFLFFWISGFLDFWILGFPDFWLKARFWILGF